MAAHDAVSQHRGTLAPVALTLAALVALAGACARTLPPEPSSAALYRDLERLVTVKAAGGWKIDRLEVESLLSSALLSTCAVRPDARAALTAWLSGRIDTLGGPVKEAYRARGEDIDTVKELLVLTRVQMLLTHSTEVADADCPFWLTPEEPFHGRQISDDRWQISLAGGGRGNGFIQGDRRDLEFGGASRALFGRVFGAHLGLFTGLEVGGGASAPKNDDGTRSALRVAADVVAPVVVRYYLVNTFFEAELGYLGHATEKDWGDVEHGLHLGLFVGGRATRVRWFFPGAGFAVAVERTFPRNDQGDPLLMLKLGFRASIDFDL
ncbi:hypothetical protein [Haliangium sp.]|uniref:hypothetical protein n=1 Tax=Haliangium sp. TaxID=2663208 RepID=UPI003D104606